MAAEEIIVIKSGHMSKQGELWKNWKRRYFKLTKNVSSGLVELDYFTDESANKCKGTVHFKDVSTVGTLAGVDAQRPFKLYLETQSRTWYFSCETMEDMTSWLAEFGKQCEKANKTLDVNDIIPAKQAETFEGISLFLELPSLTSLAEEANAKGGAHFNHVPHINLIYGLQDSPEILSKNLQEFGNRLQLCFGNWESIKLSPIDVMISVSNEMQLGFVDILFRLSKDLRDFYTVAADSFGYKAKLRRVSQPRSCILYGSHKSSIFRDKTELENLVRTKLEQHQVVNPGCISLWRTEGDPSQWEKIDSFTLN